MASPMFFIGRSHYLIINTFFYNVYTEGVTYVSLWQAQCFLLGVAIGQMLPNSPQR